MFPLPYLAVALSAPLAFLGARAGRGRVSPLAAVVVAGVGTALIAALAGTVGAVAAALPVAGEVATTLATLAVYAVPVPAAVLAAGTASGLPARRVARGYALVVGPALAALSTAPLLPDGWWLVAGVAGGGALLAAGTPLLVGRLVAARQPTQAERARIGEVDVPVRVLSTGRPNALAAGLVPGLRAVFVTEGLLARLPPAEVRAVVAHEEGHHRQNHVAVRLGAVAVFVLPWLAATAEGVPGAFLAGCLLAVPYSLGVFRLMRHTELAADRYAAERTDPAALARGLHRLTGPGPRGRLRRLVSPHPPLADRRARLADVPEGGAHSPGNSRRN